VAEVLQTFAQPVVSDEGVAYWAKACGRPAGHMWEGWIEFAPVEGGAAVRSGRETTQPNRTDLVYWASGLSPVFLEGALSRALNPLSRPVSDDPGAPRYDGPAPPFVEREREPVVGSVLNPLSVYRKGEGLLRKELGALAAWHLVNIVRHYELSDLPSDELNRMSEAALIELVIDAVRERTEASAGR
jgi:hypothetical protein